MKGRIGKLDLTEIKNFFSTKDTVKTMRRPATDQEKIFARATPRKVLISKIYKEVLKLNNKKIDSRVLKNGPKTLIDRYLAKKICIDGKEVCEKVLNTIGY